MTMSELELFPEVAPSEFERVEPLCPVFGECGGCSYQDIRYEDELVIKEKALKELLSSECGIGDSCFDPIVASPKEYHYRHRLDISFRKTKDGQFLLGFKPPKRKRTVEVDSCVIGREEISDFIPELRKQAIEKRPEKYRIANLVLRTGDDGRVLWGGMGRRSLELEPKDYFWTEVEGKKIYYSLDTFFQANLEILPQVMERIRQLNILDDETVFFDLYSGVGLFGFCLVDCVKHVVMIEESATSVRVARYNLAEFKNKAKIDIYEEKVESILSSLVKQFDNQKKIAMIDPPRKGVHPLTLEALVQTKSLEAVLYLSCNPVSLARDLKLMCAGGWKIEKVIPFDFFPKTAHLETLCLLRPIKE